MEEMNKNENVQEDVNLNAANVVDDIGMVTADEAEAAAKQKAEEVKEEEVKSETEASVQDAEKEVQQPEDTNEVEEQHQDETTGDKESEAAAQEAEVASEAEATQESEEEVEKAEKDEVVEPTIEEIKAENERLKAMLEQKNEYAEIAEVEQQEQNRLIEFQKKLRADFEHQMKAYEIPMDKTLEEIKKEDPTKGKIMEELFNMSIALVQQEEAKSRAVVQNKINNAIFKKAEQEFSKFTMSPEQEQIAAETFVAIMQKYGVEDLGEDIKEKVLTSVGRAKMLSPDVVEAVSEPAKPAEDEKVEEVEEQPKEKEQPKEDEQPEVKEPAEPVQEVNMADFTQGIVGNPSASNDTVTEHNVMEILKSLPSRERPKFYKEHAALLNHVTEVNFNKHHKG